MALFEDRLEVFGDGSSIRMMVIQYEAMEEYGYETEEGKSTNWKKTIGGGIALGVGGALLGFFQKDDEQVQILHITTKYGQEVGFRIKDRLGTFVPMFLRLAQKEKGEGEGQVFVQTVPTTPEIRLGMTIEEVESTWGEPERKALLGEKVLYRYEEMVVEFLNGAVVDVQF